MLICSSLFDGHTGCDFIRRLIVGRASCRISHAPYRADHGLQYPIAGLSIDKLYGSIKDTNWFNFVPADSTRIIHGMVSQIS